MVDQSIQELETGALARIESAKTPEELEAVRVDVLGRKGTLNEISKGMGKLAPEDKKRAGQALNAAKQKLESAHEARQRRFDTDKLNARLDAEWLDLTLPAP